MSTVNPVTASAADYSPSSQWRTAIYFTAIILSVAFVLGVYVLAQIVEHLFSETDLINISYGWVPALAFGCCGLLWGQRSLLKPLILAGLSMLLLTLFFLLIFPLL